MAQNPKEQHPEGSVDVSEPSLVVRAPSPTSSTRSLLEECLPQFSKHDRSLGSSHTTAQPDQSIRSMTGGSQRTSPSSYQDSDDQAPAVLEQNHNEILRLIKDALDGNNHLAGTPGIRQAITDECSHWESAICGRADFVAQLRSLEREELMYHLVKSQDKHDEPSRQSFVVVLGMAIMKGSDWQPDRRGESSRVDAKNKIFARLSKACADRLGLIPEGDRTFKTDWWDYQLYTLTPVVHTLVDVGYTNAEVDERLLANLADGLAVNAMQKWY